MGVEGFDESVTLWAKVERLCCLGSQAVCQYDIRIRVKRDGLRLTEKKYRLIRRPDSKEQNVRSASR